jgi:hypothetical protein
MALQSNTKFLLFNWLFDQTSRVSWFYYQQKQKTFLSRQSPYRLWDPLYHSVDTGGFKRPGREADNSPSSPSNVNNARRCNSTLTYAFMTSTGTNLTLNSRSKQILFTSGYTFLENIKFLSIECPLFTSVRRTQRSAFCSDESYWNLFFAK